MSFNCTAPDLAHNSAAKDWQSHMYYYVCQGRVEELEEKAGSLAALPTTELLALAAIPQTEKLPSKFISVSYLKRPFPEIIEVQMLVSESICIFYLFVFFMLLVLG
jgi:hypothetical protein